MTPQEAIEIIKDPNRHYRAKADGAYEYTEFVEALETAKQALEKQIPKKPLKEYGGAYRCPNCQMKHFNPEWVGTKYCDCGQALDWGDE